MSLRVLRAFDELSSNALDLASLARHLDQPDSVARAVVDRMLREGLLRFAGGPNQFFRTEAGILAVAGPRDATLFTRNSCHLCDEAKRIILPLLREFGGILREVDIDRNSELRAKYSNEVPVIFLGARKAAKHRVDPEQFRRQLASAGR